MEQLQLSLPDKPAGFEDYLAAAEQVASYAIRSNEPELRPIPRRINDMYADTIDALDEILAEDNDDEISAQLIYRFAWTLFMEDAAINSRGRYNDILGIVSMINQRAVERTNLSTAASGQVVYIEHLMHELAESIATESVAQAMDRAEVTVRNDSLLREKIRKVLVYLGIKGNETEAIYQSPDNLSAWGKKAMLEALALGREQLLSGQKTDLTETNSDNESRIKNMARKLLTHMGLRDSDAIHEHKPKQNNTGTVNDTVVKSFGQD